MDDKTYRAIFKPRGIRRDVAEATVDNFPRYIRISRSDPTWEAELLWADPAFREHPRAAVRRIGKADGIVIRKSSVPLDGLEPIIAQCRADEPASQGWTDPHIHDRDLSPGVRRLHVRGRYHEGIEDPSEHPHEKTDGKYMMWPTPRVPAERTTSHLNYANAEKLVEHLLDEHDADLADLNYAKRWLRPHKHMGTIREPGRSPEKRLDMHTEAAARLMIGSNVRRAFFVIEGAMKADALVSAGEIAFDVPSVTMWRAPELEDFVHAYLQGVLVYVVPDSDWASNAQVATQAFACRDALVEYGAIAAVAAPTASGSRRRCDHGIERRNCPKHRKRGIDDMLGEGDPVDAMEVLLREPTPELKSWGWDRLNTATHDLRQRKNEVRVIEWMARCANDEGRVSLSARAIARYTYTADVKTVWSKRRREFVDVATTEAVDDAVRRLLAGGELSTDDPLVHGDQLLSIRTRGGRRRAISRGEDWDRVPDDLTGDRRLPEFTIRDDLQIPPVRRTVADFQRELSGQ